MKKLLIWMMLLSLCCLPACKDQEPPLPEETNGPAAGEQAAAATLLRIGMVAHAEVVNIRQQASTEGRILDTARRGDLFEVQESGIAGSDGLTWALINYRGARAYISESYLYISEWQDQQSLILAVIAKTDSPVYIRAAARSDAEVLYSAFRGEQMIVTDQAAAEGWYQVFYPDGAAYVEARYTEIKETAINDALFE